MEQTGPAFKFPIEQGFVLAFNRAIETGSKKIVPPLTFVCCADQFDPNFQRRPQLGQSWLSSPIESLFHVEQTITYYKPLQIGMECTAVRKPGRQWIKQGRSAGRLKFIESITELTDTSGEHLLSSSWIDVITERSHAEATQSQKFNLESGEAILFKPSDKSDQLHQVTRTQIAMYIGAAGDFHPLHHDDCYAKNQGYPSIFAPGMLTMAINGNAIIEAVEQTAISEFSGRFRKQVWPGDVLNTGVSRCKDDLLCLLAVTKNQHGNTVFESRVNLNSPAPEHIPY